jgi:hypothetical protein
MLTTRRLPAIVATRYSAAFMRVSQRRDEGTVSRQHVRSPRPVDEQPAAIDADEDRPRRVRAQLLLRARVEPPDDTADGAAYEADRAG